MKSSSERKPTDIRTAKDVADSFIIMREEDKRAVTAFMQGILMCRAADGQKSA